MLSELIKSSIERGFSRIIGEYIPTDKNKVVANLFIRLGFIATNNDGLFALEISNASVTQTYISINATEDTIWTVG